MSECRVEVTKVEGLLSDYMAENDIDFQVRGIRSFADFDSEFAMGMITARQLRCCPGDFAPYTIDLQVHITGKIYGTHVSGTWTCSPNSVLIYAMSVSL